MKDKIIVIVNIPFLNVRDDLEIPVNISAIDLISALSYIYKIPVERSNIFNYYLKADNPKALLRGEKPLIDYGLRDGSEIWLWNTKGE